MMLQTGTRLHARPAAAYCNMGGPMTRTRAEPISAHLLGRTDGAVRCRRIIRLGLAFEPGVHPVAEMMRILAREGHDTPEELRLAFELPATRLIAARARDPQTRIDVVSAPPRTVLEQALLLGLCTHQLFDPQRPVLWTEASLGRALDLFEPLGFYA